MKEKYEITYYNERVMENVFGLPDGILARYIRMTEIIKEFGPSDLCGKHSKPLGNGLFELRLKGKEGIARVFYGTVINKKVVMLHMFMKKTQKTPKKELVIVRNRLEEVKKDAKS